MKASRIVFAALMMLILINGATEARGADFLSQFHPYITVKEEYNDNLDLTPNNKKDDFITTVQPGIKYSNMGPASGVELDANVGYAMYARETDYNYWNANGSLNIKYMTPSHINFYFKDSFTRSDDPREREFFTTEADNKYVLSTVTERAVYWRNVAAPTLEYQFGPEDRVGVNYRNNIYRSESETARDSMENYVNPFLSYWFNRQNGIYLEYGYTAGEFDNSPDLEGHRLSGRYINRFSPKSSVFAEYTYLTRKYKDAADYKDAANYSDYDVNDAAVGITHAFTPTLTASAQVGYFVHNPKAGSKEDGISYKAELRNADARTTYQISAEGGYKEDFFTSENLGFTKYHRITGSARHSLDRRFSVGCRGSIEWAEYLDPERTDTIWGVAGTASYQPLRWLTFSLELSHKENQSDLETDEYKENRAMLMVTATY
jgi:hypothetical protein